MTVANIVVFLLGFFSACLLGLIACRLVWVRAVRLTRARLERDRPETLRAFEARIAGAQARAAISIRELERALDRERQISAQARLMADQMASSSSLALAERDDTQTSLINLSDSLNTTRERLREQEELLVKRNTEIGDLQRDLMDMRQELSLRDADMERISKEADELRAEVGTAASNDDKKTSSGKRAAGSNAASLAKSQIDDLRSTVRQLRTEKNAAEASAARARLLLDARDDSEAMAAAKAGFDAERDGLKKRIVELEGLVKSNHPGPHLVSVDGETTAPPLATPSSDDQSRENSKAELDKLRQSIDAMTASLTAASAVESDANDHINALLDEAEKDGADSNLVTSLVEARDRLRSKKPTAGKVKRTTKASTKATKVSAKTSSEDAAEDKPVTKLSAATASGTQKKKRAMPRASESDLKVI